MRLSLTLPASMGAAALFFAAVNMAPAAEPKPVTAELTLSPGILDPREMATTAIGGSELWIGRFELVDQKPASITKEPTYVGRPKYGAFTVGNGPRSMTYFAIDEAPNFAGKIYLDANQNGDLTDDGPGDWETVKIDNMGRNCMKTVVVHASWGTPLVEKESGSYTLWMTKRDGNPQGGVIRTTGRVGMLTLAGKNYPIALGESTTDGLFTVPAAADLTRAPVILYVDTQNQTPFDAPTSGPTTRPSAKRYPEKFNLAGPFQLDGRWYNARPSISGSKLIVVETNAPNQAAPPPAVAAEKLPIGTLAPDFTVQGTDGKPLRLSDFKGKLVVLDFWATWCGPCQASMPDLEKLYQRIKDQDVVVLSVNVLDEKESFDAWISQHSQTDYHFNFAFDPAGKDDASIAKSSYEVLAIPAWFLISRDGKIVAKEVGYSGNQDTLIKSLQAQQVRIESVK